MQILVGCEESQVVCNAFRARGHEAYSCDIIPTSGNHPEWHILGNVLDYLDCGWDMMIAHPPCTYLCVSANKWYKELPKRKPGVLVGEERKRARVASIQFFLELINCGISRIAIENPIGIMSSVYRKPDQIIQPWQFGHGEIKATCLWLKGLSNLKPTNVVEGREQRVWKMPPSKNRAKLRSKTFSGIAEAFASQWG